MTILRKIMIPLLILCFLTSFLFLNGCAHENSNETNVVDTNSPKVTDNSDAINTSEEYSHLLNKIWVAYDETTELYQYTSVRISYIENNILHGELITGMITPPNYKYLSPNSYKYISDLKGTINNGIMTCNFSDENGNSGIIRMQLDETNEIKSTIVYKEKANLLNKAELNETLTFTPYNIKAIDELIPFDNAIKNIELSTWGNVKFLSGKIDDGNKYPVESFLVDKDGNIYYDFGAVIPNHMEPKAVEFIDINHDTLKDLIVLVDTGEKNSWARVLIQQENGSFYNDNELNAMLEYEENIYDFQDVVDIIDNK